MCRHYGNKSLVQSHFATHIHAVAMVTHHWVRYHTASLPAAGSTSPGTRQRSRSAEPPVRSSHHSFFKMAATTDLPWTSTFIRGTSSRSMPPMGCAASVFAPTQPAIPIPPSSSRSRPFNFRLKPKVAGSKPDDEKTEPETNGKTEGKGEGEQRKRKSFPWLHRKSRATKRPTEPSSEFRLFSFRHQDGKASMTVARGLKTSGKATMEAFQHSRQLQPVQNNDVKATPRKVCRESGGHPTAAQPMRQLDRPTKPRPPSTKKDDVIAKNRSHITMETDLDTLETRPVLRRSDANKNSAKRRDVTMETTAPTGIRSNKSSVTKVTDMNLEARFLYLNKVTDVLSANFRSASHENIQIYRNGSLGTVSSVCLQSLESNPFTDQALGNLFLCVNEAENCCIVNTLRHISSTEQFF